MVQTTFWESYKRVQSSTKLFGRKKMSDLQQQEIEEEMNTGLNISASHMNGITQDRCVSLAISVC